MLAARFANAIFGGQQLPLSLNAEKDSSQTQPLQLPFNVDTGKLKKASSSCVSGIHCLKNTCRHLEVMGARGRMSRPKVDMLHAICMHQNVGGHISQSSPACRYSCLQTADMRPHSLGSLAEGFLHLLARRPCFCACRWNETGGMCRGLQAYMILAGGHFFECVLFTAVPADAQQFPC